METDTKININLFPIPDHKEADRYNGLTEEKIKDLHPVYETLSVDTKKKDSKIIEIRFPSATLTCVIENNICKEAYLFED